MCLTADALAFAYNQSQDSFDAASAFAPVPFLSSHQSTNGLAQAAMMRQSPGQPTRFSSWMAPVEAYMDSESEGVGQISCSLASLNSFPDRVRCFSDGRDASPGSSSSPA
jgi:hypothetical protein